MTAAYRELEPSGNWRTHGLCSEVDPELFFPEPATGPAARAQVAAAKRVCAGCPVRLHCLEYAITSLPDGVAGGTTPAEREVLRELLGGADPILELATLMPPGGQRDRTIAGRAAAAAGMRVTELVQVFGVSRETAHRWLARARRIERTRVAGDGSPAATGAPRGASAARTALAGNRAPKGHED